MRWAALIGRIHERTRPAPCPSLITALQRRGRPYMKLSMKPFCMGLPGAMKCQVTRLSCAQASMAFEVNSVP